MTGQERWRWVRGTALAASLVGGSVPDVAYAQAYTAAPGAARAPARKGAPKTHPHTVALRLRPRAGDTVRTRFEQTVRYAPRGTADPTTVAPASAMLVIARSIVQHVDSSGALLLAVTDSVAFRAAGAPPALVEQMRRRMQGQRAELRVAPNGALAVASVATGASFSPTLDGVLGSAPALRLPGTLPAAVVAPGATWQRAMAVPSWGSSAAPPHLDVSFRFDSMTADGARAYVSLRGRVHGEGTGEGEGLLSAGASDPSPGRVDGGLVVDLARGWVVESWATFQLDGVMVSAPGAAPQPVRIVVTQRLRAF